MPHRVACQSSSVARVPRPCRPCFANKRLALLESPAPDHPTADPPGPIRDPSGTPFGRGFLSPACGKPRHNYSPSNTFQKPGHCRKFLRSPTAPNTSRPHLRVPSWPLRGFDKTNPPSGSLRPFASSRSPFSGCYKCYEMLHFPKRTSARPTRATPAACDLCRPLHSAPAPPGALPLKRTNARLGPRSPRSPAVDAGLTPARAAQNRTTAHSAPRTPCPSDQSCSPAHQARPPRHTFDPRGRAPYA